jgi:hypothetical protein
MMDATYDSFLAEVAEGRGMIKEAVRQLAKGRVWSGAQAVEVRDAYARVPLLFLCPSMSSDISIGWAESWLRDWLGCYAAEETAVWRNCQAG